ncbi:PREDICTED: complement C1r subcomponent-like protein [Chrysochloris asiatica]|uniref:Complement C1r subcomponent-like protein n=1 Tax=Chrysochloris asiatica TaxID=185453 RepID=A0A9B0WQ33_CHRAS|nr:PREDICTED: complement C1r subcomponent-like protein [Chrysochloris asiatica]
MVQEALEWITDNGIAPSRFYGHQGSPLGRLPSQKELVFSRRRLQLTSHKDGFFEERTICLHRGFLVLNQALAFPNPTSYNLTWDKSSRKSQIPRPPVSKLSLEKPHPTRWWLLLCGALQACPTQGSILLAHLLPQKLTSPGYPEPYPKGQASTTDIEAPEGFVVKLVFQDFDLEPSQDCEQDSVIITTNRTTPSRFCGHQGSLVGREFVSSGRRLQLTFCTGASSEDSTIRLHRGFLALYQAISPVVMNKNQPIGHANWSSKAIRTPVDNSSKIQSPELYCQEVPVETLTCTTQGTWKDRQTTQEAPQRAPVCGRPVTPIPQNQKAFGSSKAQLGNFPWQAFTSIYGRGGGALLGDRWVLTAAHTIYPKDSISPRKKRSVDVFLGHTNIKEMLKLGNHPVRRIIVHPDYRQNESHNFDGDIALLELQHNVPLGTHLLPVCLPNNETLYLSGLLGYVSGFGMEMGWLTTELKYSRLPIAERESCEAWLRERQRTEVFSDNMFCVGDEMQQQSVCQGDSGSVYVVWDDCAHQWVATGIVSWGIGCGKGYGFYTKVLNYVDWIKRVMEERD